MRPTVWQSLRQPARFVRRQILPRIIPPAVGRSLADPGTARVVGLLSSATGVGNSARLCAATLAAGGIAIECVDVADHFQAGNGLAYPGNGNVAGKPSCSIYHLNPPMLLRGLIASGLASYYGSCNIGYWAWELETVPSEWRRATRYVDAVMVPSAFCAEAIRKVTDKPVVIVPHPVTSDTSVRRHRQRATNEPFTVLSVFNFGSSFERKNPVDLIAAFNMAFSAGEPARLVLKTSDGERHPGELARLRQAIGDNPRIEIVDAVWSPGRMAEVFAQSDAYASLHRSEGFGLTIAEAIIGELPVVATGWSGNLDFCDPASTYLVECTHVPFSDSHGDYSEVGGARWAQPLVPHAARLLREIYERPEEAGMRSAAARRYLEAYLASRTYLDALAELARNAAPVRAAHSASDARAGT